MSQKYYSVLTQIGAEKLAAVTVNQTTIKLTHIAIGDGNGTETTPNANDEALVNEVYRTDINELNIDNENLNYIVASSIVPAVDGNFWVREIGLFDEDGDLIAIGNKSETFKPVLTDGEANELLIRIAIEVSSTDAVELLIDPSIVMASQEYVNNVLKQKADKNHTHPEYALITDLNNAISSLGFPIGHQLLQVRETINDNELVQYGGEYLRADFPKLWEFIQTQPSLLLSEEEWQIENTTNGMCGYFSSGDGGTTFRLMNLIDSFTRAVDGVNRVVGSYEADELKSHAHKSWASTSGVIDGNDYNAYSGRSYTDTSSVGGVETRPKNIGALPLIISK